MDPIRCPKCNAMIRSGVKFCSMCGATVAGQPATGQQKHSVEVQLPKCPPPHDVGKRADQIAGLLEKTTSWGQRVWDVITMAGCSSLAGLWYWYSGLATQPDYKTCATMVLLPLALIVFRRGIDRALAPLRSIRERIPPLIRLGIGLAMPFLVSNYLYANGTREFEFMFRTVVISSLASYVMLRNPSIPKQAASKGERQ